MTDGLYMHTALCPMRTMPEVRREKRMEGDMMKVLGLSFGRKTRSCDILVKQTLKGAEAAGAEVRFINTMGLNIRHCLGCDACSDSMRRGGDIRCVIPDDFHMVLDAVLDADAIVVAAPVYILAPTGQFKNFVDRFGPSRDRAAVEREVAKRAAEGTPPLDPRLTKHRFCAYISVGGAHTKNWVSFGLPILQDFGMSMAMQVINQIDAYDMGYRGNPILDEELMKKAYDTGTALADACANPEEAHWIGEPGTCPVCHCDLLTMNGTTTVECPCCGIEGKLSVEGDRVSVTFSEEQPLRARCRINGLIEHCDEIAGMPAVSVPKIEAAGEELQRKIREFAAYLS